MVDFYGFSWIGKYSIVDFNSGLLVGGFLPSHMNKSWSAKISSSYTVDGTNPKQPPGAYKAM